MLHAYFNAPGPRHVFVSLQPKLFYAMRKLSSEIFGVKLNFERKRLCYCKSIIVRSQFNTLEYSKGFNVTQKFILKASDFFVVLETGFKVL